MKLSKDFIIRKIAGEMVIVPTGEAAQKFNGMINANEVAEFILEKMQKEVTEEELIQEILKEFDIDEETARKDVHGFTGMLEKFGFLDK